VRLGCASFVRAFLLRRELSAFRPLTDNPSPIQEICLFFAKEALTQKA
jgi:hypothetical protein